MEKVTLDSGYRPRGQQEYLHKMGHLHRFIVAVCHRRMGKTIYAINDMLDYCMRLDRPFPQAGYISPTYGQSKRIAWQYVQNYAPKVNGIKFNESELVAIIPRPDKGDHVKIFLLGAESPDSLRGLYLDYAVCDEYANMNPTLWTEVLRPALSDRMGKCLFIGTPQGRDSLYDKYMYATEKMEEARRKRTRGEPLTPGDLEWGAKMFKASETGVIPAQELASIREAMDENTYLKEMECSFAAGAQGSYYSDLMQDVYDSGRITGVPYDESCSVNVSWDLGISDYMAVWLYQNVGMEVHMIGYYEYQGKSIPDVIRMLSKFRYVWGDTFLPHDAQARELGTGKSRVETMRTLWPYPIRVLARDSVYDGVDAVRRLLPVCWFDKERCAVGIRHLEMYSKEYDEKKRVYSNSPRHDEHSHCADSLRYLAMGRRVPTKKNSMGVFREAEHKWKMF